MTEAQIQSKLWIEREYGKPPPIRRGVVREPNARDARIQQVSDWLFSRWYGATKKQIAEHFYEYYGACTGGSSEERLFYRDLKTIMASSRFENLAGKIVRADRAKAVK